MSSFIGVKSYNVSAFSKNEELAQELAVFLANEKILKHDMKKRKKFLL